MCSRYWQAVVPASIRRCPSEASRSSCRLATLLARSYWLAAGAVWRHPLRHVCRHRSRRSRHPGGLRGRWNHLCGTGAAPPLPWYHGQRHSEESRAVDRRLGTDARAASGAPTQRESRAVTASSILLQEAAARIAVLAVRCTPCRCPRRKPQSRQAGNRHRSWRIMEDAAWKPRG